MHFVSPTHGCAVGDLGVIHVTQDRGASWMTVRGGNRHAALLSIHPRLMNFAPELPAKISGEQGYRSASWIAIRPEEAAGPLGVSERLQEAMARSGGSAGATAWQLPLEIPGLELDADKLLENWQNRTEGKLQQVLLGQLVRQIRVWRPHVVVIDQPAPEDAAGQVITDAVLHAIQQAGDSTRLLIQRDLAGLEPWTVDRVYLQLLPGSSGEVNIDPYDVLPRWRSAARAAGASSRALLEIEAEPARRLTYRGVDASGKPLPQAHGTDFFSGLNLSSENAVRRQMISLSTDDQALDQAIKAAKRQRNFSAYTAQSLDDPRIAGQMIAQLKDITAGMTADQAAATLWELIRDYRQRGQLDLAEAMADELIGRFPDQPAAADAARWLLAYLVSEEVVWQRIRQLRQEDQPRPKPLKPLAGQPIRQTSFETRGVNLPELNERFPRSATVPSN